MGSKRTTFGRLISKGYRYVHVRWTLFTVEGYDDWSSNLQCPMFGSIANVVRNTFNADTVTRSNRDTQMRNDNVEIALRTCCKSVETIFIRFCFACFPSTNPCFPVRALVSRYEPYAYLKNALPAFEKQNAGRSESNKGDDRKPSAVDGYRITRVSGHGTFDLSDRLEPRITCPRRRNGNANRTGTGT